MKKSLSLILALALLIGLVPLHVFAENEATTLEEEELHTHAYTATVTAPTCTEQGYTTHTCATCGDSYVDGYVDAVWHSYEDGRCSVCGCDMMRITPEDFIQYQGGVDSKNGILNSTFTNNWFANIRIPKGAQQVRVLTFKTGGSWGSAFFNGTQYISGFCDPNVGGQWITADIPQDATVLRYGYVYDPIAQKNNWPIFQYVEIAGRELEEWESSQYMERPATGCHSFSVEVNIAPAKGDPDGYAIGTDYGYIMLPTSYTSYGEPTRLIIVCHGASAKLADYQSDAWKTHNYSFWTDLGYAVMDMYACPPELSGNDSELHYGNPVVLDCYQAGYDYVMKSFNLKQDGIYVIGSSMGGLSSFQIVQSGRFPVLAQVGYCPVIDLFKQAYCNPWTTPSYQRSRIASYFDFSGTMPVFTDGKFPSAEEIAFYQQNFANTVLYSPILRNVVSGNVTYILGAIPNSATATNDAEAALYAQLTATHPCPLLIFHNTDDSVVSYRYSQYFVDMVKHSGQDAILYSFSSGGHNAWANGESFTVQGINGEITIKESQYQAYLFFSGLEKHEEHYAWIDPAVAPTCSETGLTEGSHCAACGKILKKQETVATTGHAYTAAVTAPTCTAEGYTTYTCTACGDSYVDDYVDVLGHSYENGICTSCGTASWDTDGDGVLEILAIGNSFSIDALQYTWQIADALGIEEIVIGNLYISGCSLRTHITNAEGDLGNYKYYYNDNGTWVTTSDYKISTALESRSWDYISLQQASGSSGVESTYNENLTDLIAYVQARSDAKLVWHMTWAYQQNSTNTAFANYGKDQMTMYNAILSAVRNKIANNGSFDFIVPNGTAVQNSRTSLLGDTTTRDGYHMSRDYGQYLTGLMFIRTITGLSVDQITYAPSGVSALEKAIAIESVNNAIAKPFEVTKSEYDEEGYILLQQELYKGAFWDSTSANGYNVLYFDKSISHKYFATPRFTKEELPVGSIIILEEGWQYRPEGWVTDAAQSRREGVTTVSLIVVTEEWWGDYTLRSFNLSKVGLPTLADVTENEVRLAFRIFVPEEMHTHTYTSVVTVPTCTEQGYTAYTCSLCGDSYQDSYVDALGHSYENGTCTGCGMEKPVSVTAMGNINYSVDGRIVTVTHSAACVVGYWDEAADQYIAIAATANADGSYSFDTAGKETVVLLVIGDVDGNGVLTIADKTLLDDYLSGKSLTVLQQFAADVNGNGKINSADRILLARALMIGNAAIYKPLSW